MATMLSVNGLSGRSVLPDSLVHYSFGFVFISLCAVLFEMPFGCLNLSKIVFAHCGEVMSNRVFALLIKMCM